MRDHDLPFPFTIRRLLGGWKLLFLDGKPFTPDPTQTAQWNRGAYLVNGPGHCAECHSPRDALGGICRGERFAGGPNPEGEGWVPNITQKGLGEWSVKDIAYLLQSGMTPDFDSVGGSMTAVIRNTSQLSDADRLAMAVYIKSLAPIDGPTPPRRRNSRLHCRHAVSGMTKRWDKSGRGGYAGRICRRLRPIFSKPSASS